MKLTIRNKMAMGFGILLALMTSLALVVLYHLDIMHRQYSYVIEHDAPVIANARHLMRLVVDMETGQRGFIITGNEEFLEPYANARGKFSRLIESEKHLVSDNPAQVKRLEQMELAVQQWEKKAANPEIAMRKKILKGRIGARHLQNMLVIGVGKEILDEIRVVASEMEQRFRIDGNLKGVYLLNYIQKCMVDQETGERGFLITGKDEFLEPFDNGRTELRKSIKQLRNLVNNAHDRQATVFDLSELTRLHARWLAEAAEPEIQLRKQVRTGSRTMQDFDLAMRMSPGKSILDEIRSVFDRLVDRFAHAENDQLATLVTHASKAIVDQETGQRGFLITGKDEFLQPFTSGAIQWAADLKMLRKLNDNAYHVQSMFSNIDKLERLAKKWIVKAAEPEINTRRQMNKNPETLKDVSEMLEAGTGKRILDGIRAEFQLFVAEEEKLTAQRFSNASKASANTTQATILITLISLIIGGIMAVVITRGITQPVRGLAAALVKVTQGDLDQEVQLASLDEIGLLSKSFNQMIGTLKNYASVADSVAEGDYTRKIEVKGEKDQLGLAVNRMINNLQKVVGHAKKISQGNYEAKLAPFGENDQLGMALGEMTETLRETRINIQVESAFKDVQASLAELLRESDDIYDLGSAVIQFVAIHTESQMGAIYVKPLGENQELYQIGNYAFPEILSACNIETGDDLVCQAARSKKSVVIRDIPPNYIKVTSGAGDASPRNLLIIPLYEGIELKGVIELGSFGEFSEKKVSEIETLTHPVAAAIASMQGAQKIRSLLASAQAQSSELEAANAELQKKSIDLEKQTSATAAKNVALELARKQVEQKADELAQSSKYKTAFLANMSHEIRTPMTAIMGFTEIVRENVIDPESKDWLNKIQRNGDHLLGLINDILDISKIESNKMDFESVDVSPSQILADVASLMSVRAQEKGLALKIEFDGPIPQHIKTDPTRLRQILVNLTGNAIKFAGDGVVRLVARVLDADSDEPKMVFDVVDSGIGLTETQAASLFQPFVQADSSTTRKYGGTGLGLTISKRLAVMLGGDITIQSVYGEGSTFSTTISTGPLDGVKMVASPLEVEPTQKIPEKQEPGVQLDCRVLLAEDGKDNQRLISFFLEKAGVDVTIAENGQIALDLALSARDAGNAFDVILMDMQMPVLDGYRATGKLRDADYTGTIIALTAHAMNSDRDKCLNAGCDDYTTKPINRKQLISLVDQYTSQQTRIEAVHVDG